jgi:hypothetical protein
LPSINKFVSSLRYEINCASLALAQLTPLWGFPSIGSMGMLPNTLIFREAVKKGGEY